MVEFLKDVEFPLDAFIFKHSTRCPISAAAAEEIKAASPSKSVYWVYVVEERQLSNDVAKRLGVKHESPQLIDIQNGQVAAVWSHRSIHRGLLAA